MRYLLFVLLITSTTCANDAWVVKKSQTAESVWVVKASSCNCPNGCNCGCSNGQECQCKSATISVSVPADAKLYVDGVLTKTIGKDVRTFATPALEPNKVYSYAMRIEYIRDGVVQSESKVVSFKAGQVVKELFSPLPAATYQPSYQPAFQTNQVCVSGT